MTEREYQQAIVAALNAEIGARGWTRKHLGELAGIGEQTMMRMFRCERDMNVEQLGAMLDALGITAEYLAAETTRRQSGVGGSLPRQHGEPQRRVSPKAPRR